MLFMSLYVFSEVDSPETSIKINDFVSSVTKSDQFKDFKLIAVPYYVSLKVCDDAKKNRKRGYAGNCQESSRYPNKQSY